MKRIFLYSRVGVSTQRQLVSWCPISIHLHLILYESQSTGGSNDSDSAGAVCHYFACPFLSLFICRGNEGGPKKRRKLRELERKQESSHVRLYRDVSARPCAFQPFPSVSVQLRIYVQFRSFMPPPDLRTTNATCN